MIEIMHICDCFNLLLKGMDYIKLSTFVLKIFFPMWLLKQIKFGWCQKSTFAIALDYLSNVHCQNHYVKTHLDHYTKAWNY